LKRRIAKRGRDFEASISDEYLAGLNRLYEEWIDGFDLAPVLVVPGDRLDFVAESKDLDSIVRTIEGRLRDKQGSLFPVGM
ncbi:MAG TPA: deoxynucleoside kinase, partial [Spirochaetales bacterium]|nr:deoxynucleoside kinase [Spirochaetales bacterium]